MADTGIIVERPDEPYMIRDDGTKLYKYASKNGMKIIQHPSGNEYDSAIDVESANYTYTESDIPIDDSYEKDEISKKADAWDELTEGINDE